MAKCQPASLRALTAALFGNEESGLETGGLPTEGSSGQESDGLLPGCSVGRSQHYLPGAQVERKIPQTTPSPKPQSLTPACHPERENLKEPETQAEKQPSHLSCHKGGPGREQGTLWKLLELKR